MVDHHLVRDETESPVGRFIRYASEWKSDAIRATVYSTLNKLFDIFPEILIGVAVDLVVRKERSFLSGLGFSSLLHQLLILGVLTGLIWIFESIFEYLYSVNWRNIAQAVQHKIRLDAYSHIQNLDHSWYSKKKSGDLLAVLNDDVNQLERFLDSGVNEIIQVTVSSIVISGIFFFLSPLIACFAMLPVPVILVGSIFFQKKLKKKYLSVRHAAGAMGAKLNNNLHGMTTIKSYTAEDYEISNISKYSDYYRLQNRSAIKLSSMIVPIIRMAVLSGFIVTLILGGWLTIEEKLAVGSYSVMIFLTQRLLWPFTRIGQTFDLYQRAMASTHRILSLLETRIIIDNPDKSETRDVPKGGSISFKGVTFSYDKHTNIFQNFNLDISDGEFVGIVGTTGSGKSTLIRLLLRFYDPGSGNIFINGISIKQFRLRGLRGLVSLVSQDVFLFDGTVRDNIIYGNQNASAEEIEMACRNSEASDFIEQLPDKYDTAVGERGVILSGGQKQKISIARALLKDSQIVVFDEATSSVDNDTEASIQRSLIRLRGKKTMIVIAHRLSTVRQADKIYVLGDGGIKESGSHEDLIAKNGQYKKLWNIQTGILEE